MAGKIYIPVMKMLNDNCVQEIELLIDRYPELACIHSVISKAVELLMECYKNGGKILVCGNGGSAADSLHIVGELMKSFVCKREIPREVQDRLREQFPEDATYYIQNLQDTVPAISLVNEVSLMTAYSNDQSADLVFAQQVLGYGQPGDILMAISTSGNSSNVIHAARVAKTMGMQVISLTGSSGGKLKALSDVLLNVPSDCTYQIQELHLPVYHTICLAVEKGLFEKK